MTDEPIRANDSAPDASAMARKEDVATETPPRGDGNTETSVFPPGVKSNAHMAYVAPPRPSGPGNAGAREGGGRTAIGQREEPPAEPQPMTHPGVQESTAAEPPPFSAWANSEASEPTVPTGGFSAGFDRGGFDSARFDSSAFDDGYDPDPAIEREIFDDGGKEKEASATAGTKQSRAKSRVELAERVETVADTLACLRINSISDQVHELRQISQEIRELSEANDVPSLKDVAARALRVLLQLFDALGTQEGARIIISGATAWIVGAAGWPAVTAYGLTLAAWHGKDAFMAALRNLPKSSADGE